MSPAMAQISTKHPAPLVIEPAVPHDAHDADTFKCALPIEFLIPGARTWVEDVRVAHVNAAELNTPEGKAAQSVVQAWLSGVGLEGGRLHIWGREKYGRLLADLEARGGVMLSDVVIAQGGSKPQLWRPDRLKGWVWYPVDE
jgi:endonuclease YncB( thermonuclease family)